jgi:hypothetical protein
MKLHNPAGTLGFFPFAIWAMNAGFREGSWREASTVGLSDVLNHGSFDMPTVRRILILGGLFAALIDLSSIAYAGEKVGEARKIDVTVTGAAGSLGKGDAVHRDERIRANASGLGQFEFEDGTKLAVGPNASVVIDKFVLGEGGKLKRFSIKASRGTFRFISGKSSAGAYRITTPAGTLGVRG